MTELRFVRVEEALIRQGVAARHARRAALELQDHYRQLVEDAVARGGAYEQSRRNADEVLGTDAVVVEHYAERRELRGWLYRWPILCALAPLASFAALCAMIMVALVLTVETLIHTPHHIFASERVAIAVNSSVCMVLQWALPVVVAGGFVLFARRRRIAFGWLLPGALLVCLVARQMNVGLMLPTLGHRGSASMDIGFAPATLLDHLACAIGMVAIALAPYSIAAYRSHRHGTSLK